MIRECIEPRDVPPIGICGADVARLAIPLRQQPMSADVVHVPPIGVVVPHVDVRGDVLLDIFPLQIKHVPELRFRIDDLFDRMDATRAMFDNEKVRQDLDK